MKKKRISVQSGKNKGRALQQKVVKKLLEKYPQLEPDDVKSNPMGSGGEDVLLSPAARRLLPYSIECKKRATLVVYQYYKQAEANSKSHEPLLVVEQNHGKPLAIIDLDHFLDLLK